MGTPEQLRFRNPPPRIVVYTHDTFGMGHVRRCSNIIRCLAERRPDAAILLVTGSPAAAETVSRAPNVDLLKLPTIAPTGDADDRPPHLPIGTRELIRVRRKLIRELLAALSPDVLLVDNFALGARKELLPSLEMLREMPTRVLLGLRDIADAPETIRLRWQKDGVIDALERLYDQVLVYGDRDVFDIASEYGLSDRVRAKIRYCGYVSPAPADPADDAALAEIGVRTPFHLLTVGGGGDGLPLVRAFLAARRRFPDHAAIVVTGPLMGPGPSAEVERLALESHAAVVRYLPDLARYTARADVVVSMGGYNSVVELIANGCRAVIVPRNWRYGQHGKGTAAGVEMEQQLRAEHFARAGLATLLLPENLTDATLAAAIAEAGGKPAPVRGALRANGAETAADAILQVAARAAN